MLPWQPNKEPGFGSKGQREKLK